MNAEDSRRYSRAHVALPAEVWTRRSGRPVRLDGHFAVLGGGGGLVELKARYPLGRQLQLRFGFPAFADIVCTAAVRSYVQGRGVGVEFLELSSRERERISAFVDRHRS